MTIARLNVNLREEDLPDLRKLISELGSAGLIAEDHLEPICDELEKVRRALF